MHLSESVYFTVESCATAFELWKKLSKTYENKVASTKMYLIRHLYNLRMKDSDSVQAHLNEYESLSSQITSQGTTIEDELRASRPTVGYSGQRPTKLTEQIKGITDMRKLTTSSLQPRY